MSELRVSAWKRYGKDRLYVNTSDDQSVAWFDRQTGHIEVLVESFRDQALAALTPYLTNQATPVPAAPPTPVPPPPTRAARAPRAAPAPVAPTSEPPFESRLAAEYDLALNRPGEEVRAKLNEVSPGPLVRLLSWLLRQPTEADSWRVGLIGERVVGRELHRLSNRGWRVLHSIPLARDVDIDHLLIGPGGVFTINTKHHRGKNVWVGDDSVKVNYGPPRPYVRKSRHEAARAARALERGCRFPVDVHPMLVFVGQSRLDVVPSLQDVRAIGSHELAAMRRTRGVLRPDQVEAVYAVARDRRTWADA